MTQTYTITAFSENHIGLLSRITIIFTRRHVNIHSLTVSQSAIKGISKFTIVVVETKEKVEKVVKQIDKLVEVLKAFYHPNEEIIYQEIALYKVPTEALLASDTLEKTIRKYNARILEVMPEYTIIEKTGHCEETQELFDELTKYGVKQFTRSGRVAVTKLSEELLSNYLKEIDEKQLEHSANR
ncbi:MAG: acetolactate synthase small subunit [Bacteroidales bacterium]|nr:acetolactate synthase small subunit [Bacteroidales bacterium]MBN2820115.1 acetolactate synthase small subunit [Bacteroidales bacterium]